MTASLLKQYNIEVAHKPVSALSAVLSKLKDDMDVMGRRNVVYKVNCLDCTQRYIGQTGRSLGRKLHLHWQLI